MSDFIERKRRWDAAFMDPNSNAERLLGEAFHLIEDLVEALPSPEPEPIGATEPPTYQELGAREVEDRDDGRRIYRWPSVDSPKSQAWVGVGALTAQDVPYSYMVANSDPGVTPASPIAKTIYGENHDIEMRRYVADLHALAAPSVAPAPPSGEGA